MHFQEYLNAAKYLHDGKPAGLLFDRVDMIQLPDGHVIRLPGGLDKDSARTALYSVKSEISTLARAFWQASINGGKWRQNDHE